MNNSLMEQPIPSPHEERKLWFDYIRTLEERRLQANQRSGLTNYALLALLAGLAIRFFPKVPNFMSDPDNIHRTLATFIFELEAIVFFGFAVYLLHYYVAAGFESRMIAESEARLYKVVSWISFGLAAGLAALHLWVARMEHARIRKFALVLAVWFILNLAAGSWKEVRKYLNAKRTKVPVPRFKFVSIAQDWQCFVYIVFMLALTYVAMSGLFAVLASNPNWSLPLRASSIAIVCSSLAIFLFFRSLGAVSQNTYDPLARDILLKQLKPEEIRAAFERKILGRLISDWLEDLLKKLEIAGDELQEAILGTKEKLAEAEQIDNSYKYEREGRERKAREDMGSNLSRYREQFKQFKFQYQQFRDEYKESRDAEFLKGWNQRLSARIEKNGSILNELDALIKQGPSPNK